MNCNLGKTRTRFTVNSLVFVILFWFLVKNFKLSARTKDARYTWDAFLKSVYPCIDLYCQCLLHGDCRIILETVGNMTPSTGCGGKFF